METGKNKNNLKNESKDLSYHFQISNSTNQNSKYLSELSELNENIKYINELIDNKKLNQENNQNLEENLNELLKQKSKIKRLLIKEEHKKLIEEMNLKIEKEIKKKINKNKLLNNDISQKPKQKSVNNVEIPEGTHTWRNQKLPENGTIFTDYLFLPTKKNLCELNKFGQWDLPEDVDEIDVNNWEKIKWERVGDIFMSSDFQVFYDKIEKEDIIQGNLGNCYFLSAIASLSKYPNLIEKLFFFKEKSEENCYGCYFRINGIWKLVLVDDFIPCYSSIYEKNFAFSHTNGNELWVILLEKAWAKLNGNYARIIGGDPHEIFEVLTNAYCEKFLFKNEGEEKIWLKYKNAQEKGFLMTAGTSCDEELPIEEMGLVPGHAYSIIKVKEVTTKDGKLKLINLRNPWGHREWLGDWSDLSEKWTEDLRNQCSNFDINDDGSFWMSFEDFNNFFVIGGICHLYENYHYSFLHVFKESSIKGAFLSELIIVENNVHCFLMAHQKNPRVILRDGKYQKPVLFYLILLDSNFEYISSIYSQEQNINIEITLNKGIYYIISDINYRFVQKEQHGYTLSCYSSIPVEIIAEQKFNIETIFKKALYLYSKKHIIPKKNKGGLIYKIKKNNKDFPFSFVLFDNTKGNNEIIISDLILIKGEKDVSYYLEGENNNDLLISKTILPGYWDIFCLMPYKLGTQYSIQLKTISKEYKGFILDKKINISFIEQIEMKDNNKLYEDIFKEEWQVVDDGCLIRQYIKITNKNYFIGLENISNKKVNISMKLEYKIEMNYKKLSVIDFDIHPKTKKILSLIYNDNFIGEISFDFKTHFY